MKLPGIYYAYAGILALFGETDAGIRLGLLLINLLRSSSSIISAGSCST